MVCWYAVRRLTVGMSHRAAPMTESEFNSELNDDVANEGINNDARNLSRRLCLPC